MTVQKETDKVMVIMVKTLDDVTTFPKRWNIHGGQGKVIDTQPTHTWNKWQAKKLLRELELPSNLKKIACDFVEATIHNGIPGR